MAHNNTTKIRPIKTDLSVTGCLLSFGIIKSALSSPKARLVKLAVYEARSLTTQKSYSRPLA